MQRIATSLVVLALSSACLFKGWEVVRFSFAERLPAPTADQIQLAPWADTPGVAARALEGLLPSAGKGRDALAEAIARRDLVTRFLAIRPLSSAGWLILAESRLTTGQPVDTVWGSLVMSALTGPHEGAIMLDRALFGFSNWPLLPPELKRRVANDFAETMPKLGYLSASAPLQFKNIFSRKSQPELEEIKNALVAAGTTPEELKLIGL